MIDVVVVVGSLITVILPLLFSFNFFFFFFWSLESFLHIVLLLCWLFPFFFGPLSSVRWPFVFCLHVTVQIMYGNLHILRLMSGWLCMHAVCTVYKSIYTVNSTGI